MAKTATFLATFPTTPTAQRTSAPFSICFNVRVLRLHEAVSKTMATPPPHFLDLPSLLLWRTRRPEAPSNSTRWSLSSRPPLNQVSVTQAIFSLSESKASLSANIFGLSERALVSKRLTAWSFLSNFIDVSFSSLFVSELSLSRSSSAAPSSWATPLSNVRSFLPSLPLAAHRYICLLLSGTDQRGRFPDGAVAGTSRSKEATDLVAASVTAPVIGLLRRSRGPGTSLAAILF